MSEADEAARALWRELRRPRTVASIEQPDRPFGRFVWANGTHVYFDNLDAWGPILEGKHQMRLEDVVIEPPLNTPEPDDAP